MKHILFALAACLALLAAPLAESGEFRHGAYSVTIPDDWRVMDTGSNTPYPMDAYYIADGTFLPRSFNGGPVMVRVWIAEADGTNLEMARERTIAGYTSNPDRVFETGFQHRVEKFRLKSGEQAYLISTRFYRKETGLNQSRYDLVAFSRDNQGVTYTVSIQYADPSYGFEQQFKLLERVKQLYSSFAFHQPPVP